jgi:hypothetical protein
MHHLTDVITELKRFQDAYYDAIYEEHSEHRIQYLKSQMNHLQQLAADGQEFIVNF